MIFRPLHWIVTAEARCLICCKWPLKKLAPTQYRNCSSDNNKNALEAKKIEERKKAKKTLRLLKEAIERQQEEDSKSKRLTMSGENKKLSLNKRVLAEIKHYYHGFRLLGLDVRLSLKYLFRLVRGISLTRREQRQLVRTAADMLRVVPFLFFVIVPFMEFALPFFIRFFPGLLPSTFQEVSKQEEKIRRQLKVRTEMADFLQETLKEVALEKKNKSKDNNKESKALEFAEFLKKVRTEGANVSNTELLKFIKLFEDELTLDNLSVPQLRALCNILSISTILKQPEILRLQLNLKLSNLKSDDKLIDAEGGVDVLSAQELQSACRARGMRALGLNEDRLRAQLKNWLELSLGDNVPPSLLLMSRALYLPEEINFVNRLRTIISALPEDLGKQTAMKLTEFEGGKVDPKARLELLRNIEEELNKERIRSEEVEKQKEIIEQKSSKQNESTM